MSHVTHIESAEITIRTARTEDMSEIARVAGRDTHELPMQPLLVAQVGEDVRAAISLKDGAFVADPFHRTSELVQMLKIRAGAVNGACHGEIASIRNPRRSVAATRAA
ncbi:MAG: hypothetical protein M3331_08235 [Actinomycetota bacterium]|nr:hypothetical protein [Actinomycetota bacterium]